jgi:hypothetical protein
MIFVEIASKNSAPKGPTWWWNIMSMLLLAFLYTLEVDKDNNTIYINNIIVVSQCSQTLLSIDQPSLSILVTVQWHKKWHSIWLDCGRPWDGLVAGSKRRTRAAYHYAVRNSRNNSKDIIKQRFACTVVENRNRDFWRESKKVNGKARDTQRTVDSLTQNENNYSRCICQNIRGFIHKLVNDTMRLKWMHLD